MTNQTHQIPVIVLLDNHRTDTEAIDLWLQQSRFSTCEAGDIFNLLEQISDYTVRETPEVFYCHVDQIDSDRRFLEEMLPGASNAMRAEVIAIADTPSRSAVSENVLASLERRLDRLISYRQPIA